MEDLFPSNGDARAENEKTRERINLEELQRSAIIDCANKLTTPGSILESGQLVAFRRGRWGGVSVSSFVIIMG